MLERGRRHKRNTEEKKMWERHIRNTEEKRMLVKGNEAYKEHAEERKIFEGGKKV